MNHLSTEFVEKPKLVYPFAERWAPELGRPFEVSKGLYWLRMPLPMALDHVNIWLLQDAGKWVIIDTGLDHQACKDVWQQVFDDFLSPRDVSKIIVTHFHPDHIGLATWLREQCNGCPILMTEVEFRHYRMIVDRDEDAYAKEVLKFTTELGYSPELVKNFIKMLSNDDKPESSRVQENAVQFVDQGDRVTIDSEPWQVVIGSGHSPHHACLWNSQRNILISGDQAIPRISSNVSVYPSNRHQDPLGDWIDSCHKLKTVFPVDALVLPGHQEPFQGLHQRMDQLIEDHNVQLNRLRLAVDAPITVVQARSVLFDRELNVLDTMLASGETLAHLNYLWHRKELDAVKGDDGVIRYQSNG